MVSSIFWRSFLPFILQEKYDFLSRTVSTFLDENISNQLYMNISVVGIPYIYIYSHFMLSLINVYHMWCALSIFIVI